ncbi:MAG TPA: kinase [Candidatus Omnitrophota bacterium]|nr:kinase [Candidatus Omnitrophota bacterium]HPB67949.1 kinase [Candidatus Omnitrophota bacterium]HQO57172.1 kinase [Candidatus Omnitrophota bacterium]
MIISRTPFRISFFGGGTDYPAWYEKHKGAVLATTIDKYCYITTRYLPPFFSHKSRIVYTKTELVKKISEIDHPAVREVLKFLKIRQGIEIHHDGDLPARTGLGSSSSFTVGLLNSLYALKGIMPTKERLAKEAIYVEQEMCRDNVGCQDQVLAAYGGFNFIEFGGVNDFQVRRVTFRNDKVKTLENYLMLFFTGFSRTASEIAAHQIRNIPQKTSEHKALHQMAYQAVDILSANDMLAFGKLLDEAWKIKRSLSDKISTPFVDDMYAAARKAGAVGGKLLGAGGGGFLLLCVPPARQKNVRERLKKSLLIPFRFEDLGSQIIFYQPNSGKV